MRRLLWLLAALAGCAADTSGIPPGYGQSTATVDGQPMRVFTYRPAGCTPTALLLVFHGVDRNAATYRDDAVPLAQRSCLLVAAPLFDEARFPAWRYQRGGIVHGGTLQPVDGWTTATLPSVADWARASAGLPGLPYWAIGHSAGAQFLSRVAAYDPGGAKRFVIANPSTWVRARTDVPAPYGFGPPFPPEAAEAAVRRYLALPITVLLGEADTGSRNLSTSDEAEEQGATRIERGRNVFAEAEAVARAHGWPFGWRLAAVPYTGHNAARMFGAPAAFEALTGP